MPGANNINKLTGLIVFTLFFFTSLTAMSQDIIKFKSGKEVKAVIVEVDSVAIKYREYSDPAGPLFTARRELVESFSYGKSRKSDPAAVKTKEKPSSELNIEPSRTSNPDSLWVKKRHVMQGSLALSVRNVKTIMADNSEALEFYEKGAKQLSSANSFMMSTLLVGLGVMVSTAKTEDTERIKTASAVGLSIDAVLVTTAIILTSSGKKNVKKAVWLYNDGLSAKPVSYLRIGPARNGVGVTYIF